MAFVVAMPGVGQPLVVVGCQKRQADDRASRTKAKAALQAELVLHWLGKDLTWSFSHLPGQTWAVATDRPCLLGIDAAGDNEFGNGYPLHKVFHANELESASPGKLWSAKEAAVKALGCGFDGVNPLDIKIIAGSNLAVTHSFRLSVWSWQQPDGVWVSVAYGEFPDTQCLAEKNVPKKGNAIVPWN